MSVGGAGRLAKTAPADVSGASFEQVLGQTFSSAMTTLRNGEAAAIQGLQGSLPVSQVVDSMMSAQRTLQSALAIRDKVVSAYQEIARMAI